MCDSLTGTAGWNSSGWAHEWHVISMNTNKMPLIPSSRAELFLQLQHAPCGEGATGILPADQTHSSSLLPSPSSVTGPYRAWSRGGLAGLHHRHRGLGSALQPLVFCTVCNAAGCLPEAAGCHSGRGCRDVGCGGLWTTSASPSGMSQTRQGTLKRTQT